MSLCASVPQERGAQQRNRRPDDMRHDRAGIFGGHYHYCQLPSSSIMVLMLTKQSSVLQLQFAGIFILASFQLKHCCGEMNAFPKFCVSSAPVLWLN
jgi:hypothetical protein